MSKFSSDVVAQRTGVVEIAYQDGSLSDGGHTPERHRKTMRLRNCLPIKVCSQHLCINDPAIKLLIKLVSPILNKGFLSRIRIHNGTHCEMQYELLGYGIPLGVLPVNSLGECNNEYHSPWLQKRRRQEELEAQECQREHNKQPSNQHQQEQSHNSKGPTLILDSSSGGSDKDLEGTKLENVTATAIRGSLSSAPTLSSSLILEPTTNDVILGRGQPVDQHSGNIQFRYFLKMNLEKYESAPHNMKYKVGNEVLRILLEEKNVRFLKRFDCIGEDCDDNADAGTTITGWVLVNDMKSIREKILRTFRRLSQQQRKRNSSGNKQQ